MNIFESMAHALIGEHGRSLFRRDYSSNTYGYGTKFWRIALLCYGKNFYSLPKRLGLTVRNPEAKDANSTFAFPDFTAKNTAVLGIPLPEMFLYPTMGDFSHRFTPLHFSTGLLKFAPKTLHHEAAQLRDLEFMKRLWPLGRKPEDFATTATLNPYRPEDFGLEPYELEKLQWEDGQRLIIDELGNAAWFPQKYVEPILDLVSVDLWYNSVFKLARTNKDFVPLREKASRKQLYALALAKRDTYTRLAKYIRHVPFDVAKSYLSRDLGVAQVAGAFRGDAPQAMMTSGLRALATVKSESAQMSYRYIGRPLTYEDLAPLHPSYLLTILKCVKFELVEDVIRTHSEQLSSLLFKIPNSKMKEVMDCMSPDSGRDSFYRDYDLKEDADKYYPDTPEGNDRLFNLTSMSKDELDLHGEWDSYMKPLITQHVETRMWRDTLLGMVDPDVAFLAVTRYTAKPDDPVPHDAIDNVLRSHPNASMLIEHVQRHPLFTEGYPSL